MRASSIIGIILVFVVLCLCFSLAGVWALGQDVGADVGGGAGIFRPKNPEAKKRTGRPTPLTKRGPSARTTAATSPGVKDRVEELLDKGNQFRDARRFAEAEAAYQDLLKIKPRDGRA